MSRVNCVLFVEDLGDGLFVLMILICMRGFWICCCRWYMVCCVVLFSVMCRLIVVEV